MYRGVMSEKNWGKHSQLFLNLVMRLIYWLVLVLVESLQVIIEIEVVSRIFISTHKVWNASFSQSEINESKISRQMQVKNIVHFLSQ